jgi:hypothetical protein
MKFILVFLLIALVFTAEVDSDKKLIQTQITKMYRELIFSKKDASCAKDVESFRRIWRFVPEEIREMIFQEIIDSIMMIFPSIPYETVQKLVKDFGNERVPAIDACKFARETFENEIRRREECVQKVFFIFYL